MIVPADPDGIRRAAEQVRNGGVIAYPTETVYGLGADPFRIDALKRIFAIKGRNTQKALIVLIPGIENLHTLTTQTSPNARRLMAAFWPGPLTLIFKAHPNLPSELLGGRSTIALRHSNAPITQDLLSQLKGPITSTSANRSGNPPAESALMAAEELGPNLDLILDGGRAADKKPSTVVDVSGNDISILREGTITAELVWKIVDKDL